jgi:hypothetical protein
MAGLGYDYSYCSASMKYFFFEGPFVGVDCHMSLNTGRASACLDSFAATEDFCTSPYSETVDQRLACAGAVTPDLAGWRGGDCGGACDTSSFVVGCPQKKDGGRCPDIVRGVMGAPCSSVGSIGGLILEACVLGTQCQNAAPSPACLSLPSTGQACSKWVPCQPPLSCVLGVCGTSPFPAGAPCSDIGEPCGPGLTCATTGLCVADAKLGDTCVAGPTACHSPAPGLESRGCVAGRCGFFKDLSSTVPNLPATCIP